MAAALERKKKIARVLGKAAPSLSEYLTVDNPFLLELVARDVITNGNKETIRAISTMADKVEELLNILRSSAKAYDGFMEVLKCDKTMDLYDLMKEFEDKEGLRKDDKPKPSPYVPHEDRHVPHQDRHDGPTPALDQVVSERDVLDIVGTVNLAGLDDVYTLLGLEDKDKEDASLKDVHNPKKQAKNLLNIWRSRMADQATRNAFLQALEECPDLNASFKKLKTKWNIPV